ncbi:MAG: radical SAM protein [archaeon]
MVPDSSTGPLPAGCVKCLRGEKLVLFVTGICAKKCYYCSLSNRRKMKDAPFANERKVHGKKDLLLEAERMDATGAGVTGGDPLLKISRTLKLVKALKKKYGKGFHIHLYTTGELGTPEKFRLLREAGVDEIRFHFNRKEILDALKLDWVVGGEIPAIPGNWRETTGYLRFLAKAGAAFCNLNELDWSEGNLWAFKRRGFGLKARESYAVKGSEEFAKKVLAWARKAVPKLSVHYCSSRTKDAVQVRKRYIRTAARIKKPFEKIDRDGLLVKGVAEGVRRVPGLGRAQFYNKKKRRVEFSPKLAKKISGIFPGKVSIVSVAPTSEETEMERLPFRKRKE